MSNVLTITKPGFQLLLVLSIAFQISVRADEGESNETSSEVQIKDESAPNAFERFQLILDRNIFDPDRRGPRQRDRERRPEPPREESFTLLGTMSYADKQLAFFNGTDSDWTGAIKLGESLGNHKLTSVEYDKVVLDFDGKIIELRVGSGRSKRGDEEWRTLEEGRSVSGRTSSRRFSSSSSSDNATNSDDSDAPDLSGLESNDILKQLMERRKQQMGQ